MAGQFERQRQRFAGDPADRVAYETLEEHYFLQGAWSELTALYEARLQAIGSEPSEAARTLFRLGQVFEERTQNLDRAAECYRRAAELDPSFRPPIRQLRRLHAGRGQWEIALQLADAEARTRMRPYQRAEFLIELGAMWLHKVGDADQALDHYRRALDEVPDQEDALVGLARALEKLGRKQEAVQHWQSVLEKLRGPDRAPALVSRARLLEELGEPADAERLYRAALEEDPRHREAVEALADRAAAAEQWTEFASLQERRFDLTNGAIRRAAIALDAGRVHLDRLDDLPEARRWFSRALELFPEDPSVHLAMAEVERRAGHPEGRARHLERALELTDDGGSPDLLRQAAELSIERGDPGRAADHYRRALEQAPHDARLLESLAQSLAAAGHDGELAEVLERQAAVCEGDPARQADLLAQLGALYEERLNDPAAAREAYESALRAHPARPRLALALDRVLEKLEDHDARRALLGTACESAPAAERPALLCTLGELLYERDGDSHGAARAFEQALAVEPGSARALAGLARVAAASGDHESLLRTYEREVSVTRDVERIAALAQEIGRLCEAREEPERALPAMERWAQVAPQERPAIEALARLQETLGRTDELVGTLEQLERLLEGSERAGTRRRLGFLHAAEGRDEQAVTAWRAALEIEPDDVATLEALRDALDETRHPEELVAVQRRLVELLPAAGRGACLIELADLLAGSLDDAAGALAALERAVEDGHETPDVARRIESLLERVGRHEELLTRLERRRAGLESDDPELRALDLRRARLLLDPLGRYEEATALFRELHRQDPSSAEALEGLERAARASNDHEGLAAWLEARARSEQDPEQRARLAFDRAVLLEEDLALPEEARAVYEAIVEGPPDSAIVEQAAARLEALLERTGEYAALCERFEARIMHTPQQERAALHLRVGRIARHRLSDRARALYHLEAAAKLAPEREEIWRGLAQLNEELNRMPELLRALEGELATSPSPERELALRARAARLCAGSLDDFEQAERHYLRVLELDPTHAEAGEFALVRLERNERFDEMARILESRLSAFDEAGDVGDKHRTERRTGLRLRLAALRAERLDDLQGAIELLESALEEAGPLPAVSEPLADLYQRTDRGEELVTLCRSAAEASTRPAERAEWLLRLGQALRDAGDDAGAAQAYRGVLVERPEDRKARASLRELYRSLGEAEPLARLLEYELRHATGTDEIPLRLELAALQEESLGRPPEAFAHLRRALELAPGDARTLERALSLAGALDRPEEALSLCDAALARADTRLLHGKLWARRGTLLADGLGQLEESVTSFRRALELEPSQGTRRALRRALETLERWDEALGELRREVDAAAADERIELVEHGARIAEQHVSPAAAVPWYEQLRTLRPEDPEPLFRLADIHRRGGRFDALERALAEAAQRLPESDRRRDLERERAEVLEQRLNAVDRAVAALEEARRIDPAHAEVRTELERLYERTGRGRELAALLAERLASAEGEGRSRLLARIAAIHSDVLDDPEAAIDALRTALDAENLPSTARIDLLRRLGDALGATGRAEEQARVAEDELAALPTGEPVFRERRFALRLELARIYERELADPDAALAHLRAVLEIESSEDDEETTWAQRDAAERRLIELLRSQGNDVELARRLAERLAVEPSAEGWLELAQLREERLWAPAAAADAYREVLAADPTRRDAWRGLRRVSERVGDWREVAHTLEQELERAEGLDDAEGTALWRRLGQVCADRLGDTTRASRAFAAALKLDPQDRVSLAALEGLFESMEDWRGALDFYNQELELLGDDEDARCQQIWLRIAALQAERLQDPEEASRAYASAALLGTLPCHARAEWARLLHDLGRMSRYAGVFASWLDDPDAGAQGADHLHLANVLEELERHDEALARLERAVECAPDSGDAWERLALARDKREDAAGAAEAWARCGELRRGADAGTAFCAAACGLENADPERAAGLLVRAVAEDPTSPRAHALLARVAERLERHEEAERAAARGLELGVARDALDDEERIETALAGARSARARERLDAVERFATEVLELAPDHTEARTLRGEARFDRGALAEAREDLELRLAQDESYPERAAHLARVAAALEMDGDDEAALARYREALVLEPTRDDAQAGLARLLEQLDRTDEAADALSCWAEQASDARTRANRLVQAAALEQRSGRTAEAERRLRLAVAADASHATAWSELARMLWEANRSQDALDAATRALESVSDPGTHAALLELRAKALEREGRTREAAAAYGEAARGEPPAADAALAAARLLRGLGDWSAAAELLAEISERQSAQQNPVGLARVLLHLGRLRAGPLEDIEGAVAAYRHALKLEPGLREAREALASLLVHRPTDWEEAVDRHAELVDEDPTRAASIRALARIAHDQGDTEQEIRGHAILRAIGTASAEERRMAPARLPFSVVADPSLANPAWEALRQMVREAGPALAEALGASRRSESSAGVDPLTRFRDARVAAEGDLAAAALVPLPEREVRQVMRILVRLAFEEETVQGEAQLVNALAAALGRRQRRKLRRLLGEVPLGELEAVDIDQWRSALRELATAVAVDRTGGDLRSAICAILADESAAETSGLPPQADLTPWISECDSARRLLARVVESWRTEAGRRRGGFGNG